jgi:hypothetical protein
MSVRLSKATVVGGVCHAILSCLPACFTRGPEQSPRQSGQDDRVVNDAGFFGLTAETAEHAESKGKPRWRSEDALSAISAPSGVRSREGGFSKAAQPRILVPIVRNKLSKRWESLVRFR